MAAERMDWPAWMQDLGRRLRRAREFLGLSQDQVARLSGVSQGAVSRLEAGRGLATPMLIVLKVQRVLARALADLDPALVDEDMRRAVADPVGDAESTDPELEELIRLYRRVPERQRPRLVAAARATADSLAATPGHTGETGD